jgi:gluconolactonase
MIFSDRLVAITPDGELITLFEDGDREAAAKFDAELDSGEIVSFDTISATGGKVAPWLTSLTFGGPDLRTVYLGSLKATSIPYFPSPVAGLPLIHWTER